MDPKLGTAGVRPPVDAIYEFSVLTSTYDASFGRNGAGQVNVVTKSGANRFSGSAYEFFRNSALDNRNAFAPRDEPAPDYNRNQFGGSVGGPIAANRAVLLRGLREHAAARGHHPRHQRADAGGAAGRLLAVAVRGADRSVLAASRFRAARIPSFAINPIGAAIAGALSPAEPQHAVRQLRLLAGQHGRCRSVRRAARSRVRRRVAADRPLQLQRSAAARAVRGRRLLDRARLRQRRRAARPESVAGLQPADRRRAGQRRSASATTASPSGCQSQNPQIDNRSVGLEALATNPRDAGPEPDLHHRLLAARPGVQQPAGEHLERLSAARHRDLGARRASDQVRRRVRTASGSRPTATSRRAGS